MEIVTAEHAGFCFGVEKAVEEVYRQIGTGEPICTYGEIIHNEAVVEDLSSRGVNVLEEDAPLPKSGAVVIRSHGVAKEVYDRIEKQGLRLVDATCPFVRRIHETVQKAGEMGHLVVVIGDASHPEVRGIAGWAKGPITVIGGPEEAAHFSADPAQEITIVSQTTFNGKRFQETVEIFRESGYNIHIANTICNATSVRQEEAEKIASGADIMIVVGGAHSSNTRKLYEICKGKCAKTYLVQQAGDLRDVSFAGVSRVGITAGASTPKTIIEEVQTYVRTGSDV